MLIPILAITAAAFGFFYLRRKRKQRLDQQLRISEEAVTYHDNKDRDSYPPPPPAPAPIVPDTINDGRPESKAELDAIHTARARTARHPSENFLDPRVELDAVATARVVDEEAKRRTWERQELDGSGLGFGTGAGGSDGKK